VLGKQNNITDLLKGNVVTNTLESFKFVYRQSYKQLLENLKLRT